MIQQLSHHKRNLPTKPSGKSDIAFAVRTGDLHEAGAGYIRGTDTVEMRCIR